MSNVLIYSFVCCLFLGVHAQNKPSNSGVKPSGIWYRLESSNVIQSIFAKCIIHTYTNTTENFIKETITMQTIIGDKVFNNYYYRKGALLMNEVGTGLRLTMESKLSRNKKFMCQKMTSTIPGYLENHLLSTSQTFKPRELELAKNELKSVCTEKLHPIDQTDCKKKIKILTNIYTDM